MTHGHVDVALRHGRVAGVALWLLPGRELMTPARQARAALPMLPIGLLAPRARPSRPEEPHWYLVALAVDPSAQGQGTGSRLLHEGVARAETTGRGCYLETMLERNVRLYRKFGFEVLHEAETLLPGGPPFWFMWRTPEGQA